MSLVSPDRFARTLAAQQSLPHKEWLERCDELAKQQPALFFELLTFPRDGLPADSSRLLVDYLSTLQLLSHEISTAAAEPVPLPEFRAAVLRMIHFFHSLTTDDRAHFDRMLQAWAESVAGGSDPVIWAGCFGVLRDPAIQAHSLFGAVVCTLSAIADVYARRLKLRPVLPPGAE